MTKRISLGGERPTWLKQIVSVNAEVKQDAKEAGLDLKLLELLKIRVSQLNGCAFCLDMHYKDARKIGETEQRIYLLNAWREAGVYTEQEEAALALADAMTKLSETQDVAADVYERATTVFTEEQYTVIAWAITIMNAFNRLNVTSHTPVPA
ncbi:carboxymuconolactone decarboxylase family protein [Amycolatopsis sp.]|uniref:carboxymuconolactone decarboxylase family protein n=1 Tax=Amycolatopsis sp. TaxID=37632 RepID=UPI002CA6F669|nr:carboxymuconolactone decarboxylase family protein [Amycolatopsis sp.]HVV09051.1 carboxymuconolactone decarboxylase family protein [Amycolatopsis sp.]